MHRLRLLSISAVVVGLVLGAGALGLREDRAEAAPEDDIEAVFEAAVAAWNAQDAETFVSLISDEGLMAQFDLTRDEAVAALGEEMEATGPIASATISDIFVTSGQATAIVDIQFAAGFALYEKWEFTFDVTMGGWLIGANEPESRPIPGGVPAIDLFLDEYSFQFNKDAVNAADGNFAFNAYNIGEEDHEVVVFKIETDDSLGEVAEAILSAGEEEEPEGISFVTFGGEFGAGDSGTVVFAEPFAPGRYGLICFFPAPDGTPHVALGMVNDFVVGSQAAPDGGGPITPPSTGDAGLLGGTDGTTTWLLLGLALTLMLGGTAGIVASRSRA